MFRTCFIVEPLEDDIDNLSNDMDEKMKECIRRVVNEFISNDLVEYNIYSSFILCDLLVKNGFRSMTMFGYIHLDRLDKKTTHAVPYVIVSTYPRNNTDEKSYHIDLWTMIQRITNPEVSEYLKDMVKTFATRLLEGHTNYRKYKHDHIMDEETMIKEVTLHSMSSQTYWVFFQTIGWVETEAYKIHERLSK